MAKETDKLENIRNHIRTFPASPGLYFMKGKNDTVLYIGKAKNLRSRAANYFQPSVDLYSTRGPKIAEMIEKVLSVDYLETKNEVEAVLNEARLIKDIRPPYNTDLTDDKTFPYLEITTSDDFPGVYITRTPKQKESKLFGPFTSGKQLRPTLVLLQKIFKFRTCRLDIDKNDSRRNFFRPCLLYSIKQCTAPCANKISQNDYKKIIKDLTAFLTSKHSIILRQLKKQMTQASKDQNYEQAATCRDRIRLIESLDQRGIPTLNVQPELFAADPAKALEQLQKILNSPQPVRIIEGIDIAHLSGTETVGSLVKFIDGRPFKAGYRRFRIKSVTGINDYAAIAEVVTRRYKYAIKGEELWPDLILIDGGKGQLQAAQNALKALKATPVKIASIAKKQEEIFIPEKSASIKLPSTAPARKLLQYVRDESHRFAQHYHHILRAKSVIKEKNSK